ncbi:MAG: DUF1461 domain-containing protein [Pseudomonadota bacterium]
MRHERPEGNFCGVNSDGRAERMGRGERRGGRFAAVVGGGYWLMLLLSLLLLSLYISWRLLALVDYGYGLWYDLLDIEATIETHGPRNTARPDFQHTDRAERERLFGEIARAINQRGEGLSELVYHTPDGRVVGPLLTEAELIHLNDVARLVSRLSTLAWAAAGLLVLLALLGVWQRRRPPSVRRIGLSALGVIAVTAVVLMLAGPVRVFYALHEVLFPADHQWFFYYHESLMSMMMQAPNLFGPIALLWLVLTLVVMGVAWWAFVRSGRLQ